MEFTAKQRNAIALAAKIGDEIRQRYPEMADRYRSGMTAPQLAAEYGIHARYDIGPQLATAAVRMAIRGYGGTFYPAYEGLIQDSAERERLALDHNTRSGAEEYHLKRGIHALTSAQKADLGRKGGMVGGALTFQRKIGCHGLPPEVLHAHCRRIAASGGRAGAVASVIARGLAPYVPATSDRISEREFVSRLASDLDYQGPVRVNFRKLAATLNDTYHAGMPYYNRVTLKIALQKHRRKAKSQIATAQPELIYSPIV